MITRKSSNRLAHVFAIHKKDKSGQHLRLATVLLAAAYVQAEAGVR